MNQSESNSEISPVGQEEERAAFGMEIRRLVHELNNVNAVVLGNLTHARTMFSDETPGGPDKAEILACLEAAERKILSARELGSRISAIGWKLSASPRD